jgi:hypothetical protein
MKPLKKCATHAELRDAPHHVVAKMIGKKRTYTQRLDSLLAGRRRFDGVAVDLIGLFDDPTTER